MKTSIYRKLILIILVFAFSLSLAACGGSSGDESGNSSGGASSENTNRNSSVEMPYTPGASFNPISGTNLYNLAAADLMFEGLFDLDENLSPVPVLCESYSTDDGIKYTFKIKSGITFHDGSPLTASDCVNSIVQAKGNTNYVRRFSCIKGISASSDTTFNVTLWYENYSLPALLSTKIVKSGTAGNSVPVGTGPYSYSSDDSGTYLVPYSGYRDQSRIFTDKITLVDITSLDFTSAFESGGLDIVSVDPTEKIFKNVNTDYDMHYYSTTTLQYIGFNFNSSIIGDSTVRTAISSLINREYIANSIMSNSLGASPLILNPILSSSYDTAWEKGRGYNVKKAEQLLDEAGIKDFDGDGWLDYPRDGGDYSGITINFIVNKESSEKVEAAEYITQSLQDAGFNVRLNILEWAEYLMALTEGNYTMYYAEVGIAPDYNFAPLLEPDGTLNYGGLSSEEYSDLVYAFLGAKTSEEKLSAAKSLCETVADKSPLIPIGYKKYAVMVQRQILDEFNPNCSNLFYRKNK